MNIFRLAKENRILRDLRDKQAVIINTQLDEIHSNQDEIDRLRSIDRALSDFIFERNSKERDEFAREGFEEVVASRPLKRKFEA